MPRLVYLSGVGLALVAGAFLLTDTLLWCPGVTQANVRRIREGMTWQEVKSLLGEPANRATRLSCFRLLCEYNSPDSPNPARSACAWEDASGSAVAVFDRFERLVAVRFSASPTPTTLGRFRAWLGW
jgi:hypothetical protein